MTYFDIGNFDQIYQAYKGVLISLGIPADVVDAENRDKLPVARTVFEILHPECAEFLLIVSGDFSTPPSMHSDFPDNPIVNGMCFTKRFLGTPVSENVSEKLFEVIGKVFFFGLILHLTAMAFPTRSNTEKVDCSALVREWIVEALIANRIMKSYVKDAPLVMSVYRYLFQSEIEPFLKSDLNLGWWKRGKCESFFENLFLAGALLGMQFDMKTLS